MDDKPLQQPLEPYQLKPGAVPTGSVLTYEYGIRLDASCIEHALAQISQSRRLYNDIVACIRAIILEMNDLVLSKAGSEAIELNAQIERLGTSFAEAKARDDEPAMKSIAQDRRLAWRALAVLLKEVRNAYRSELQSHYLARIGRNSSCDTYRIRCDAVAAGLGWATANAVLAAALVAFKKSFHLGRPPRFAVGSEKDQDTLTLQFTAAGGVESSTLLAGTHSELALIPAQGCGRRKYGELRFRMGSARANCYATGTWQYHRPIPSGATVSLARLVRHRIGKDYKWTLQLVIKPATPVRVPTAARKPLAAVHMGWAADADGRQIAGIADSADPGSARILRLPPQIEQDLARAASIQGQRDAMRDKIVPSVKAIELPAETALSVVEVLGSMRPLKAQFISANRIHYLCRLLTEHALLPDWLNDWRKEDRLLLQAHTHIARRARNARRDFYRNFAIQLGREYDAIVIEPLALAEAAQTIDEVTGKKNELSKKARAGRVVAALYELESAIRWAAVKTESAILELVGKTAAGCSVCGGTTESDANDGQLLRCIDCGAELDRKQNGAARAYQLTNPSREEVVAAFWAEVGARDADAATARANRLVKMALGRQAARTTSR